jgi:hypothetical protein
LSAFGWHSSFPPAAAKNNGAEPLQSLATDRQTEVLRQYD